DGRAGSPDEIRQTHPRLGVWLASVFTLVFVWRYAREWAGRCSDSGSSAASSGSRWAATGGPMIEIAGPLAIGLAIFVRDAAPAVRLRCRRGTSPLRPVPRRRDRRPERPEPRAVPQRRLPLRGGRRALSARGDPAGDADLRCLQHGRDLLPGGSPVHLPLLLQPGTARLPRRRGRAGRHARLARTT
ncbi:MAG: hypothetical protein QOG89_3823, partial [Thermomicrobiales bacterium]|nr:hypothetical protein [Thermomicrobiales bacterium]